MMLADALVDSFRRVHTYLRISVTERCNLRCRYCMPNEGITLTPSEHLTTRAELLRLARIFASLGVVKVRLTGGEPLIRPDIEQICAEISSIPGIKTLAMTTNGILLPRKIRQLRDAGVTALNISLDTLDAEKYVYITRRQGLDKVTSALQMAEHHKFHPIKLNCVVVRGVNDEEVYDIAKLAKDRSLEVRFIEYMPFDGNEWARHKMVSFMEMMDRIERGCGKPLIHAEDGEVAKLFRIDGWKGKIGFITPMTQNFCGKCNRLRLTADGVLKVCLFGAETPLLPHLRTDGCSDDEIAGIIQRAVLSKEFSRGGKESVEHLASCSNRPMIKIGG